MNASALDQIRNDLQAAQARVEEMEAATDRTVEAAMADVQRFVQQSADVYMARRQYAVASGEGMHDLFTVRPRADGSIDLAPVLALVLGRAELLRAMEPLAAGLPTEAQRKTRLRPLGTAREEAARLAELEELEVLRLESEGFSPGRRRDANPAVVLRVRP